MEICEETSVNGNHKTEETLEESFGEIEIRLPKLRTPKEVITLDKLSQKAVQIDDLISENLKKIEKLIPDVEIEGELKANKTRHQIEGLVVAVTAYKLKRIKEKAYLESNRFSDNFIEARYISNLLQGVNKTIKSRKKKPKEVRDILYSAFIELIKEDDMSTKKEKLKFDSTKRIYHTLMKRFVTYDTTKILENLEEVGKAFERTKENNIRKRIEEELAKYKKMPYESLKQLETIEVAKAMMSEEENIRYALSKTLTDKFK